MIKIDSSYLPKISGTSRVKQENQDQKFKNLTKSTETSETAAFQALSSLSALMPLQELLNLQSVEVANAPEARSKEVGEKILKELDKLHLQLLMGEFSKHDLKQLSSMANQKLTPGQDSKLDSIVQEIEQRLAIELAKIETALI